MITVPIEIGDVILTGKFKNHKVTVQEIGIDDYGLPTVNGKGIMKIRIAKLMPKKVEEMSTIKEAPAKNIPKIQKLVDAVNVLIQSAVDSDGDPLMVVDNSGTWEEPMIYEPVVYSNGRLKFTYTEPYSGNKKKVDVVNSRDMQFEGIPMLRDLSKWYRKAIKDNNSGKIQTESKMKLSKKETIAIKKVLRKRISEGIDNRSIDVKIKKENETYWLFLQLDNDKEENITNVGFETIELARHAARMKGFNIVGDKEDKQEDSFNKLPDSATPPKPDAREKTPSTEKPKEIDLGKEKTIKLEETIKKLIRKEISRVTESNQKKKKSLTEVYSEKDLNFVDGKAVLKKGNKILAKVYDRAVFYPANNLKSGYPKNEPYSLEMSVGSRGCSSLEEVLMYLNKYLSEGVLTEAPKMTKKIEQALLELKKCQDILAKANAQIAAIKKKVNFDKIQKRADELLKEQLWDFLEELKKDQSRIVKLKGIVMNINRHQASPITYEYEKVLDKIMEWVNQDVKLKIAAELKACEKLGKTKANISFTTEGVGDVWDSIKNFFSRFIPALKAKGEKIDAGIADLEQQLSEIE